MSQMQQVLQQQRSKITFDVQKMSEFLFQPQQFIKYKQIIQKTPSPKHDFNLFNKGRIGVIKQSLRTVPQAYNGFNWKQKYQILHSYIASIYQMPAGVHVAMFTFCIQMMGTDTQHEEYLKKCYNWDIIGCYAQTQLGHGSDVQNIETTATYNEENDTFTINSPTITSAKFWPGQLGFLCNWALVFAQMIVKGVKHGVYAFLVQIRDDDYNVLPGIQAGDIGPKFGFHSKDNGYLILHNVVIPKRNMLRRYVSVNKKGEIKKKGDPKVSYATMMSIRQHISCLSPKAYSLAIITSARYSVFRKQFKDSNNKQQSIIQYQTQQNKIITRVAEYYAIFIGGNNIRKITDQNFINVKQKNDFSLMNQTHACLCLGKAFYSDTAFNGMQICRRSCGGHGYSHYSGMPSIIFEYASNLTMQGQNSIMYLQVARYVLKCYKYHMTGKKPIGQSAAYISSFDYLIGLKIQQKQNPVKWNTQNIRILLAQCVCNLVMKITGKIMSKQSGMKDTEVTNYLAGINLHELGLLHAAYYTYNCFKMAIQKQKDQKIKQILNSLCIIYGVEQLMRFSVSLIQGEFITQNGISELNQLKQKMYRKIRPELIGLVDAFAVPQRYITSALAKGNPYENYLQLARKCELNLKPHESGKLIIKQLRHKLALHPPKSAL